MMMQAKLSENSAQSAKLTEEYPATLKQSGKRSPAKKHGAPTPSVFTAAELMLEEIPPVRWILPGILPEGLTILAGKPKMGKSWLALDLALAVANGGKALGIQVEQGDVLYLALEDTKRRLQSRIEILTSGTSGNLGNLSFEISWPPFDQGGLEHLDRWLEKQPSTRLVIIDTFARVRIKQRSNANIYSEDYGAAYMVKALADKHRVAILLIHHLRKARASDPIEEISGSTGLTGAADNLLVLRRERGQADAFLCVTGRDIDEAELALMWDATTAHWKCLGAADDYRLSAEREEIRRALLKAAQPLSPKEVAEAIGKNDNAVKQLLWKMQRNGQVEPVGSGKYTVDNNDNQIEDGNSDNGSNPPRLPRLPVIHDN